MECVRAATDSGTRNHVPPMEATEDPSRMACWIGARAASGQAPIPFISLMKCPIWYADCRGGREEADSVEMSSPRSCFRGRISAMLTRRTMLLACAGAGALFALQSRQAHAAASSTVRTPVNFDVPRGACDCHVHVFDPAQFPYFSGRVYTPP